MRKDEHNSALFPTTVQELSATLMREGLEINKVDTLSNDSTLLHVSALDLLFHGKSGIDDFYLISKIQQRFIQDQFLDRGPFKASFVELDNQLAIRTGPYKIEDARPNFRKIIDAHRIELKKAELTPYYRDHERGISIEKAVHLRPPQIFIKHENHRLLKQQIQFLLADDQKIINVYGKRGLGKSCTVMQVFSEANIEVFKLEIEGGQDQSTLLKQYQLIVKDLERLKNGALLISPIVGDLIARGVIFSAYDILTGFLRECSKNIPVVILSHSKIGASIQNCYPFKEEEDEIFLGEVIRLRSGVNKIKLYPGTEYMANPLYSIIKNKCYAK